MSAKRFFTTLFAVGVLVVASARAQCLEWRSGFGSPSGGTNGTVSASVEFDDGSGPALYIVGSFDLVGNKSCRNFARWNGTDWTGLSADTGSGAIYAITVFDDGLGPALYLAGTFTTIGGVPAQRIAKWTGSGFSALGLGLDDQVIEMLAFNDGTGTQLYVAGTFSTAGGAASFGLARWGGAGWSPMSLGTNGQGHALGVYDDGSGQKLYVGGNFNMPLTGGAAICVARWDGLGWSRLGTGTNSAVYKLDVYPGPSGPELYAAGLFTSAGGAPASRIARWNGTSWSALPGTIDAAIYTMIVHDDGSGPALYVGGPFNSITGIVSRKIARWNGTAWSSVGGGVTSAAGSNDAVWSLARFPKGVGSSLFAMGQFQHFGSIHASSIGRWDGLGWSNVGAGNGAEYSADVDCLATYDDGNGPALYAGGTFDYIGTAPGAVAKWNGSGWVGLGPMGGYVRCLEAYDDGTGTQLFAFGALAGFGTTVASWNGSVWTPAGSGPDTADIWATAVFDDGDGPDLYCGGEFSFVNGSGMPRFARWNANGWSKPSGDNWPNGIILSMAVYDDGNGPALFIGGTFQGVAGLPGVGVTSNIVKWDGTTWSALGSGADGPVTALQAFDDGTGSKLYVAGNFTLAGGVIGPYMARWDGSAWSAVGGTFDESPRTLAIHDDGAGPALYAGGGFSSVGGLPIRKLARWDGVAWSGVGGGVSAHTGVIFGQHVSALTSFDDGAGNGPDLWVGGDFDEAGSVPSRNIAVWNGCVGTSGTYCHGDDSALPCPCGNASPSAAFAGCLNSLGAGGSLRGSGSASLAADTFVLLGGAMPDSFALYFQGTSEVNGGLGVTFGDGSRCVGGSIVRLKIALNTGGASQYPALGDPSLSASGSVFSPGSRTYQIWYRDSPAFCTSATFNLTNGLKCVWAP